MLRSPSGPQQPDQPSGGLNAAGNRNPYSTTTVTANCVQSIGDTHRCVSPHVSRCATICAVPRARAAKVRGGPTHAPPGGWHTIAIGEMPGARTAGLLDVGAEGQGNCAAITMVPTATWSVVPFCAGVTVTVPWARLGEDAGEETGGVGRVGRVEGGGDGCPEAGPVAVADGVPGGGLVGPVPPGTPVVDPLVEPGIPEVSGVVPETGPVPDP